MMPDQIGSNNIKDYKNFPNKDLDGINNNYMTNIFDDIIENYKFNNVLDYGCGNGIFGIYLKQKTQCNLIGVDGSEYGVKKSKELGYDQAYHIKDFCTQKIPLEDQSADFIISKDILEHLIDPDYVLNEVRRICKKDGLFLFHLPNQFPLKYRFKFLFTNNIDTQNYSPDANEWNLPHIRFYNHKCIIKKLKELGFDIIEDYSKYFVTYFPKTSKIPIINKFQQYLAKKYPSQFSIGFTILARKR
jgi:ubiquinone/menaquinone biosynthesis C-methylase UbiE